MPDSPAQTLGGGATSYPLPVLDTGRINGAYTVDSLYATFPPAEGVKGKFAYVTDLWGGKGGIMQCIGYGPAYFWEGIGDAPPQMVDISTSDFTIVPHKTSKLLLVTGSPAGASRKVIYTTTNAPPGYMQRVRFIGSIGLFGLQLNGLDVSPINVVTGSDVQAVFDQSLSIFRRITGS